MRKSGTLEMPTRNDWDRTASRRLFTRNNFKANHSGCFVSADAKVLEKRRNNGQDEVLGSRYGRVATAATDTATQVGPRGQRSASSKRE